MKFVLVLAFLGSVSTASAADNKMTDKATPPSSHVMMKHDEMKWGKGPEALPAGVEVVVLEGDPSKEGHFTLRAKMPANYRIPPHTHPTTENLTVISGELMIGMGKKYEESKMTKLGPGGYVSLPNGMAHFAGTKDGMVIQVSAMGPFEVNYINPKDDPRKAGGTTLK